MISASNLKPRIIPVTGTGLSAEIDRAQSIDPTVSTNREKVEEIGREGTVGWLKKASSVPYRLTQLEYGNIEFWQKLVNSETLGADGQTEITLSDFKSPYFDILAYLTDDDSTFRGTVYYPSLRTAGFSINIGDPQAMIERNFDFTGEIYNIYQGNNKYIIFDSYTCGSGSDNDIDLTAKPPIADPDNPTSYMIRVVQVSGGVSTELVSGTGYTYSNSTKILTITSVTAGDIIKYWYSSSSAPTTQFTNNDSDVAGILGDCVSLYLYIPASGKPGSSDYLYRVQSASIDVRFDREDLREIGNKNVIQRGIKNSTVTVNIGRKLEQFTIEEVLRGEAAGYGKLDVDKLTDNASFIIKIFSDNTKTTFKYGMRIDNLTATTIKASATKNEYVNGDVTMESEDCIISADESVIG